MLPPLSPIPPCIQQLIPKQPPAMQPPPSPRGIDSMPGEPRPRALPPWQVRPKPAHPQSEHAPPPYPDERHSSATRPSEVTARPASLGMFLDRDWPGLDGPTPVHDSTTQVLALCAATRAIADAVAFHARFGLSGEPLASLYGMLASGIHCTIAVREHALAHAAQGAPTQQQPPPERATDAVAEPSNQFGDTPERRAYVRKLQRATVQAMRYKRQPQTQPYEPATTQQIRELLDPTRWP